MFAQNTPGVYIQEIQTAGPISGVGTSTAAFVGPTRRGPVNQPTFVTNLTEFRSLFGEYVSEDKRVLAYTELALRGFFENGGTGAFVIRVSTASTAALRLDARAGAAKALVVTARQEGLAANSTQITIADSNWLAEATGVKAQKTSKSLDIQKIADTMITLKTPGDAKELKIGDVITFDDTGERAEIRSITSGNDIVVTSKVVSTSATQLRIANLIANQRVFRLTKRPTELGPGSVLHLKQTVGATATEENCIVRDIDDNGFVYLDGPGLKNSYSMKAADGDIVISSNEFDLTVKGSFEEKFQNLSLDPRHPRYALKSVASQQVTLSLPVIPTAQPVPSSFPKVGTSSLSGGSDDDLLKVSSSHYDAALAALSSVRGVSLVCAPDVPMSGQAAIVAHCEKMGDRFALLDSVAGASIDEIKTQRAAVESQRGFAALYYPRILVRDPTGANGDATITIPASGHIAGICARSDAERGVHKAPANELISGAVGLELLIDDRTQDGLNAVGINVLRIFPGKSRPIVWGARTTVPTDITAWRYVNVRRLFLFVEQSILEGIRWAVFEPNDLNLWKKLHRTLTEFLTRVWRSGALFGATSDQAFFVKIDEELNPPAARALGQVNIEIGIAPVRPAEFVIVRIGMWDGGSNLGED